MYEERQPLLTSSARKSSVKSRNGENDSGDDESLSIKLGSIRNAGYGTESTSLGRIIPIEDRITYTWNEINAFAVTRTTPGRRRFWKRTSIDDLSQTRHILNNVSGLAYPGQLLAIMGSSGAGKTTLLNALTFRSADNITVTGTRCVNGQVVNLKSLTNISAYVQQDDLFIATLTVKEHLIFQALVRMDRYLSYDLRMKRVEEVLSEFGLKKCENTTIGEKEKQEGISGGERKRLAFAAEVLTNPYLMFCDEPTSGLDSFMALNIVQVLKSMAQSGKTVIFTIHQPSSELYAMFHKILLLAEGRVAFLGSPEEAEIFFTELEAPCPKNYNPADYFIQLLAIIPGREESCRQAVNLICNKFDRSKFGAKVIVDAAARTEDNEFTDSFSDGKKSRYKASWCAQFRAVLWRAWLSVMKNPLLIKVRALQTVMISLVIGAIYYGQVMDQNGVINITGVIFIFLTNTTFQNVFAVVNVFCSELPVFLREHKNGMYRTDVYFLSKTLSEIPFFVMLPIVFTSACYFLIGLNSEPSRFLIACGIVILVTNVATSFGYMISCMSNSVSMALSVGPPLILPFLILGGFLINTNSIPIYLQWLSYLSWFRYGNEALLINQWKDVTKITCPVGNLTCLTNGHMVLQTYNFDEANFVPDILALVGLILGLRLVAFLVLLYRASK